MLKKYVTWFLALMFIFNVAGTEAFAKAKKKKSTKTTSAKVVSKKKKKKSKKRYTRRHSGNGPDLRALTTESPDAPYMNNPDGLNSVETQQGI